MIKFGCLMLLLLVSASGFTVRFQVSNRVTGTAIDSAVISLQHITPQGNDTTFTYATNSPSISNVALGGYILRVTTAYGSDNLQAVIAKDTGITVKIIPKNSSFAQDTLKKQFGPYFLTSSGGAVLSNKVIEPGVKIYVADFGNQPTGPSLHLNEVTANGTREDPIQIIGAAGGTYFMVDYYTTGSTLSWVNIKGMTTVSIDLFFTNNNPRDTSTTDISNCRFDSCGFFEIHGIRLFENNIITIAGYPQLTSPRINLYDNQKNIAIFKNCCIGWQDSSREENLITSNFFKNDLLYLSNCTVKGKIWTNRLKTVNSIIEGCDFTKGISHDLQFNLFYGAHIGNPPLGIGYNVAVNSNGDSIDFYNNIKSDPHFSGCGVTSDSRARNAGLGNVDMGFNPEKTVVDSFYKTAQYDFKLSAENPTKHFSPAKKFSYDPKSATVSILLANPAAFTLFFYDLSGRCLSGKIYTGDAAGLHKINIRNNFRSQGIYLVKFSTSNASIIQKVIIPGR